MSIPIRCTGCSKPFRVKDHLTGKRIRCPFCTRLLRVPATNTDEDTQDVPVGYRICPSCAEMVRNQARKCRFCGEALPPATSVEEPAPPRAHAWSDLSDEDLDIIEDGENPFDGERSGRTQLEIKALPTEHRQERRQIKRHLRELARMHHLETASEFDEVKDAVVKMRKQLLASLHALLVEAKKQGVVQEEFGEGGEILYRFTGDDQTWKTTGL